MVGWASSYLGGAAVLRFLLVVFTVALPGAASATLIGDTVTCQLGGSGQACQTPSAVVGSGIEFTEFDFPETPPILLEIDLDAFSIEVSTPATGFGISYGGSTMLTLADLDFTPEMQIVGFTLSVSNVSGLTAADVSFTADSVTLLLAGSSFASGGSALLTLQTAPLPEPATASLAACAFVAALRSLRLGARARR
jgi:hypothetical protein